MRHYIIHISKNNKAIANCRIEAANKTEAEALVTECKFADAGYTTTVTTVKKDKTKKVCTKEQLIAAIKHNETAAKPMLPTKEDCKPAPTKGYPNPPERIRYGKIKYTTVTDDKGNKVILTPKKVEYAISLTVKYGDFNKGDPKLIRPQDLDKVIKILKDRQAKRLYTNDLGPDATPEQRAHLESVRDAYARHYFYRAILSYLG